MLILLSPAKKLDFASAPPPNAGIPSQPRLLAHSEQLIQPLKTHSAADLAQLMRLSDKLAQLNYQRYQDWSLPFTPENAKVALAMFHGDVYEGLQADTLAAEHWNYAQQHLRILSGLYGVLSPLDLIQPYRLEMGTPFANQYGKDLYAFWGETITQQLNQDLQALKPTDTETVDSVATHTATALLPVINLASNEYFKAVQKPLLQAEIITPVFKDMKNGQYKMISFYAKRARGLMARYLLEKQPENNTALQAALLNFKSEGYAYNAALTTNTREPVFTRQRE